MSKQPKALVQEKQIFSILEPILKQQIERQDEQGRTLHTMFDGIRSMYTEFSEGMSEMKSMVQEVRDSVTLINAECTGLQSAVASKSIALTKDRYSEEDGTFKQVVGLYRRMIWKQLKQRYEVPKYNCIRRIDYHDALDFVAKFKPEDYL